MSFSSRWMYSFAGLAAGAVIGALLHESLEIAPGWVRLMTVVLGGLVGIVVGNVLFNASRLEQADSSRLSGSVEVSVSESTESPENSLRFFASSTNASSELKPMRVKFQKTAKSPPDMELELLIERFDSAVRVSVAPGVLEKMSLAEVVERTRAEATSRAPRNAENAQLQLVFFRSEGALKSTGRSPDGWTLEFEDGTIGLKCVATASGDGISLQYSTAVTYLRPDAWELPNLAEMLTLVRDAVPTLEHVALRARMHLPLELMIYNSDASVVADIDPVGRTIRNTRVVERQCEDRQESGPVGERFPPEAVLGWSRGLEVHDDALAEALAEPGFAEAMRSGSEAALQRTADAVFRHSGNGMIESFKRRLVDEPESIDVELVTRILARVPSGLATAALHEVASLCTNEAASEIAERYFKRRRMRKLPVYADPMESLDFVSSRARLGKSQYRLVPLRSTFNLNDEVLTPLANEVGLRATRRRLLSGDSDVAIAVYLRADSGDTEALITSTPLPVPCHILHIVGSQASEFEEAVESSGLTYGAGSLLHDLRSSVPTRVHRAALYLAAQHMSSPEGAAPLLEAYRRGKADRNLRRAILFALSSSDDPAALSFIEDVANDESSPDYELAAEALARLMRRDVDWSDGVRDIDPGRLASQNYSATATNPRGITSPPVRQGSSQPVDGAD